MNIRIDQLFFNRTEKNILSNITLTIPDKEITVISGSNGCGKSTLLKLIAGIETPDAGKIFFDEENIAGFSPAQLARKRAILLQNPQFPGTMTADELLKLSRFAFNSGNSADQQAIEKALSDAGACQWRNRKLHTLSGGEMRKVFLAAALAQEPELLLLDEVEAGLDADFCSKLPTLLKKLQHERNLTVVMVMHDLDLALHCAGNFLALKDGEVEFFSPVNAADFPAKLNRFAGNCYHLSTVDGSIRAAYKFQD